MRAFSIELKDRPPPLAAPDWPPAVTCWSSPGAGFALAMAGSAWLAAACEEYGPLMLNQLTFSTEMVFGFEVCAWL